MLKNFFCALIAFVIVSPCFAEDLKFVDAFEDTGYYYDAESVKHEPPLLFVKVIIIKADTNLIYVYDTKINYDEQLYEILSSKLLTYDTREKIESNDSRRSSRSYSKKSKLAEIIDLIFQS